MTAIKKLDDEEGRALALDRYEILDTGEEKPFENIVQLVQKTLNVPICAVSLVDRDRQWFKAQRGLTVRQTARDISFCTHAIKQSEPFIVTNATRHALFGDNPLVTGEPHIRAYAGIPLRTPEGYNVGSLCAIDTKPRDFEDHEIDVLKNFAEVVVNELELRQIASTDSLTGAMSRQAFKETAASEIERAKRYGRTASLALIDIDELWSTNVSHGHDAGNVVIKELAQLFMDMMRKSDFLGRIGGEELILLMPETNGLTAFQFVERVREAFAKAKINVDANTSVNCTLSAGVAEFDGQESLDAWVARTERVLATAKEEGRNRSILDETTPEAA